MYVLFSSLLPILFIITITIITALLSLYPYLHLPRIESTIKPIDQIS